MKSKASHNKIHLSFFTKKLSMKFLIKSLLLFCFGLSSIALSGQYGNEWIDYTKTYYKIKLKKDQIYRLDYNMLEAAGVPLNADGLKMMHRGEEVPLYVSTSGPLGSGDYIEFHGKQNDGTFDTQLFENNEWQITELNSSFTDTSTYYLYYDLEVAGLRYTDTPNNLDNLPPKDEYFTHTYRRILDQGFFNGEPTTRELAGVNSYSSNFGNSEGFVSSIIGPGQDQNYTIPTVGLYNNGGTATIETKVIGRSNDLYYVAGDHHVRIRFNDVEYIDAQYEGYQTAFYEFDVPVGDMEVTNVFNLLSVGDIFNATISEASIDKNSLGYIFATYPRSFDLGNIAELKFELSNDEDHYLEIENFNGGSSPILYDLTNNLRITPVLDNGVYKVFLPEVINGPENRELFLTTTNTNVLQSINNIEPIQFSNFGNPGFAADFIILTHPKLMETFEGFNQIERYKEYRASEEGGGYQPLIVDITELYDQFSEGIMQHPLAIRNFCNYIIDNYDNGLWNIKPDYLLLLGKSLRYNYCTNDPVDFANNLVPTYGASGSDVYLSTRNVSTIRPQLATGRVSAKSPGEVKEYLDKLIEYEAVVNADYPCTIEDRMWLKDVLHIAAGFTAQEETEFTADLNSYKNSIENVQYGGNVVATLSSGSNNISTAPVEDYINAGLGLITFVGHSNGQFWQYGLNAPQDYDNEGKYPFILSSSCFVGDIHQPFPTGVDAIPIMAERFTLAPNRGTIGFLASVQFGFPTYLHEYTNALHENFTDTLYGEPIGLSLRKTIADIDTSDAIGTQITVEEFTLSGDPAVSFYHFDNPEYILSQEDVSFVPNIISAGTDSVDLHITVFNVGRAIQDSVDILIEQTFPDGSPGNTTLISVQAPAYEETFVVSVPLVTIEVQEPIGINNFQISIDPENALEEDCEDNNIVVKNQLILPTSAYPIDPCDFAIVSTQNLTLKAATSIPIIENLPYIFELDTTAYFDSPLKKDIVIESIGGIIEWELPSDLILTNQTVYYWRVAAIPEAGQQYSWNSNSFIYINGGSPGWNQSHYYQFASDDFENCYIDENNRLFEFESFETILNCETTYINNGSEAALPFYSKNGGIQLENTCLYENSNNPCRGGIIVATFEPSDFSAWFSTLVDPGAIPDGNTGNCDEFGQFNDIHCTQSSKPAFQFSIKTDEQVEDLMGLLDSIPDGNYMLMYSINEHNLVDFDGISTSAIQPVHDFFTGMGLQNEFDQLTNSTTFIAFGRKGFPSYSQKEMIWSNNQGDVLELEKTVGLNAKGGRFTTSRIGPSKSWNQLLWSSESILEGELFDDISIDVYGIDENNTSSLLFNTGNTTEHDLSNISADLYPYLILSANIADTINLTAPQLQHWRVLYDRAPELIFNESLSYSFYNDTIQAGETGVFEMAISNVSDVNSEELLVSYIIINGKNQTDTTYQSYPAIEANGNRNIKYEFSTNGLSGLNYFQVILNPDNVQTEKMAFNNVLILPFYVEGDNLNPLLDVTFDGVHIQNGDIVSASPEIFINLDDENPYLPLDPSGLEVYLVYPDGTQELVDLNGENIQIVFPSAEAVAAGNNQLEIMFNPTLTQEGTYQLQVVGQDNAGNYAGLFQYQVSFEVILDAMITNVVNYPNPFTTSTQFIFTLTGTEVPENFMIQIMSVKGTVVRELTEEDLGPLHIGKNITETAWDGTDMFGNELANGVYFYRVVANQDGEDLDLFTNSESGRYNMSATTNLDATFGKYGIGKMYKMR